MTSQPHVEFDRSVLGKEIDNGSFEVTRERVLAFARAIGEVSSIYSDDSVAQAAGYPSLIAPPTFVNTFIMGAGRPDPKIEHGTLTFHAGQSLECLLPIKPGDSIRTITSLDDVYAKTGRSGTMVFAVWKTQMFNQNGEVVAVSKESFVRR